jgi:glucose/arabinose dehydrogenase
MRFASRLGSLVVSATAFLLLGALGSASASELPTGFRDTVAPFEGLEGNQYLEEPTNIRFAPDGRVFVAEKTGKILVYDGINDSTPELFDDLRTQVFDSNDRGLLGIAVDPRFAIGRPYIYALYTYDHVLGEPGGAPKWGEPDHTGDACPLPEHADSDACPVSGRLVRINAAADQAGEEKLLIEDWCQQFSSHSIGDLQFGPEGDLYVSGGDGASFNGVDYGQHGWPQANQCADPPGVLGTPLTPPSAEGGALRAQVTSRLGGKILRVDPDTGEGLPGNPLFTSPNADARRIIAKGFRNPFRFAIDPKSNEIYVDGVGWDTFEEIDHVPLDPGTIYNSGWPCYEGPAPQTLYVPLHLNLCESLYNTPGSTSPPFFYYKHGIAANPEEGTPAVPAPVVPGDPCNSLGGSAISGIAFTENPTYPAPYDEALFFADAVRGCIYMMPRAADGDLEPESVKPFLTEGGSYPGVDLEIGPEGDLYYVKLAPDAGEGGGTIHKISYDPDAPIAHLKATPAWGAAPLEVELNATESTSPDGEPLTYKWDLDGNGTFETTGLATRSPVTYSGNQNVVVSVQVSTAKASTVAHVTLYPGDTPPKPAVELPNQAYEWTVGDKIHFAGYATDAEDGPDEGDELPNDRLYWRMRLFHCPGGLTGCHAHPLQVFPSVGEGDFTAPDHDFPSHIEIAVTATDSRGLTATKAREFYPLISELSIASDPPGLKLTAGSRSAATPFILTALKRGTIPISAPETAEQGGKTYRWVSWSDGGARVHDVLANSSASYTAQYKADQPASEADQPASEAPPTERPTESPAVKASPVARLSKRPPRRTQNTTARFSLSADQAGSQFECSLDGKPFKRCGSSPVYKKLKPGAHVLKVRAVNPAGMVAASPVVYRWKVLAKAR